MSEFVMKTEKSIMVPMPDGINLSTDLYFPDESGGPWPVLLMRNPYDKNIIPMGAEHIASDGIVFVMQYVRGCYESEGQFQPLANERRDGAAGCRSRRGVMVVLVLSVFRTWRPRSGRWQLTSRKAWSLLCRRYLAASSTALDFLPAVLFSLIRACCGLRRWQTRKICGMGKRTVTGIQS